MRRPVPLDEVKEQLKTDVELKLRLAGIKVNSMEETVASEDWPRICVTVNSVGNSSTQIMAFSIAIRFKQGVSLLRSPYTKVDGVTWYTGSVGICLKSKFTEVARKEAKELVDNFINAYLTANPKK